MNAEYAISVLNTLRQGWYDIPLTHKKKRIDFLYESYQHSAIEEIKYYLLSHDEKDPLESLEKFREMVEEFSCKAYPVGNVASFMFSTYYDVCTDVIDVLLTMNKEDF